ncbi:MAG: hypothetical protein Q9223_003313 [Gallowayella weberi]
MRAVFVPLDIRTTPEFESMCEALERLRPEGLVAWDRAVADGLTKTKRMERLKVSIYVEESYDREWNTTISKSLHYMLDVGKPAELERLDDNEPVQNAADEIVLVVFTSGTTDQPKACPHTGIDLSAATYTYARWRALGQRRSSLLTLLPNNHVLSCTLHITWWRARDTVVYLSPSFDAEATLHTLETGCCNDIYKDIIIRSGKNISPALMEACLTKISAIHTQIVGIPDDLAGEVPVTVIVPKTREEIPTVSVLQEKVRPECGVDYVPARVNHHAASNEEKGNSTLQVLTSILARLLGRHQTDIPFSTSINQFADSITLVRLRSEVKRRLDKYIPDDLLTHKGGLQTLANQLGHGKPDTVLVHQKETAQTRGPPSSDDMIHVGESLNKFRGTQSAIELVLEQFRLSYETDVQSVFPVPDLSHKHLTRTKDYSYNLRSTMLVTRAHISQVREAIEATLVDWAVFRCIAVDYSKDQRLFVDIRCGEPLQKLGLLENSHQNVANFGDSKNLARSGLTSIHAHMPGPLFRAILVNTQDSGKVGVIIIANHAVFDALSMAAWRQDLERPLRNPSSKLFRVSYQSFANTHYNYRTSASAAKSIAHFADKLQRVNKLSKALWPAQRAPRWYIGNDIGWKAPNGAFGQPTKRHHTDTSHQHINLNGIEQSVHLPNLPKLYPQAKVSAAVLFKAALALLTLDQTGENAALIGSVQAARQ